MATKKFKQALKILVEKEKIKKNCEKLEKKIKNSESEISLNYEQFMDERQGYMVDLIEKSGPYGISDLEKYK